MRLLVLSCACMAACAKPAPVQDPLDYLRVGVDPRAEAAAIMKDLTDHGFEIGRRVEERSFVAFDAVRGPDSTVRVITTRGTALSILVPDVRWPERFWVDLAPDPRPDFDRDGQRDVIVAIRERDRTCLAWAEVDERGFVSEVFRPDAAWGESPCVIEIDDAALRLVLEVDVPEAVVPGSRVRLPAKAVDGWTIDRAATSEPHWSSEVERRERALEEAEMQGDPVAVDRLRAELAWLERLRSAEEPVLEPAGDGEEAR